MEVNKIFALDNVKNSVDLLYDDDDIMIVSLDLFHIDDEGECNRNNCNISRETAEKSLHTIYNKPIICRYNSICKDFVTDVTEHARDEKEKFEMRIAGHIPSDSRTVFVERENGKTYCNTEAVVQKKYMPQLVDILKKNNGELKVSIEIIASGKENDEGVFVLDEFVLQAVTLLSPNIDEGIEGSHLKVMKFSQQEISQMNKRYIEFSKNLNNKDTLVESEKKDAQIMNSLSVKELSDRLWDTIYKHKYSCSGIDCESSKYYIEEIYPEEHYIIIRDNEFQKFYKATYSINDMKVDVDISNLIEVNKAWHERPLIENRFSLIFAKTEYGIGDAIKVDKSQEAVSDKAWGDVDKTELRHKVLSAKNYKTLVYEVYAEVEEGWEDSPSSKLKYPIMLIEGDTAVYARYGLASALAYAKAENNESVVNKVEKLYRTIKIQEKEEKMESDKELQNSVDEIKNAEELKDMDTAKDETNKEELQNAEVNASEGDKSDDKTSSDKEDLEEKYSELEEKYKELETSFKDMETQFSTCKDELQRYKAKEDKEEMLKYLHSYKKCFTEEELKVMASKIETAQRCEFEKEVDDKVKEFAKKMSEDENGDESRENDVEIKNSKGFMARIPQNNVVETLRTIDDVLNSFK